MIVNGLSSKNSKIAMEFVGKFNSLMNKAPSPDALVVACSIYIETIHMLFTEKKMPKNLYESELSSTFKLLKMAIYDFEEQYKVCDKRSV